MNSSVSLSLFHYIHYNSIVPVFFHFTKQYNLDKNTMLNNIQVYLSDIFKKKKLIYTVNKIDWFFTIHILNISPHCLQIKDRLFIPVERTYYIYCSWNEYRSIKQINAI